MQGLENFFRYWPLLPIGWRIVQNLPQRRSKTTNTAPTSLLVQHKQEANPLNAQLFSTCDYSKLQKYAANIIKPL